MHSGSYRRPILAAAAIFALAGCSRRPSKELDQAKQRLAEAQTAQAPVYAPSSFEEARKTLREAEDLAKKHKYEDARIVALESAAHSRSAVELSSENRRKMLDALRLNLDATERLLSDAEQETAMAEAQHLDSKQIEMFRRDVVDARAKLAVAKTLHAAGDLPGGRKASNDARDAADATLHEIRYAIAQNPIMHPAPKKKRRRP
jgi:hypothetical protein